ncbi:MAG TPA: nuclear transport factor 2 family protein [Puia sp.]|nr:nuclear transport factor 2 family protein [Puia sp.]
MRKMLTVAAGCCILLACNNNKPAEATASVTSDSAATAEKKPPPPSEFADPKYMDMGKKDLAALASGDIDAWMNSYADNAVYRWSAGDSLHGKAAIAKYWKDRRSNVIDSISFANDIWLPLKVNQPQKGPDMAGVWLIAWHQTMVKYKTGKKLVFWVHTDSHYNSDDKIDVTVEYIDKAPINKALGK